MSNEEILSVKEDIREMKGDIKDLVSSVNDLKVQIADNYLKKADCKECKANMKIRQPFWDAETKKSAFKWAAIVLLTIFLLLAGKDLAQIANILPKG